MAGDKANGDVNVYEAALTGVVTLASQFNTCVEAFGLVTPSQKWQKEEQILLCRVGVQQARLLVWGDVVGISSPPASVTDRAIPKHPSAAYPDLKEPTFFPARDERLDEPDTRQGIENALQAIVDRTTGASKDDVFDKFGMKAHKKFATEYKPALDNNRLEGFRERYELLREVAETYAQLNTRYRSYGQANWHIANFAKFDGFIKVMQEKIDYLINSMDVKERVDRGMRMDIRGFGWHLSADRQRIAMDVSKLRLLQETCKDEYPEYMIAVDQALQNIERERRENVGGYNPYAVALGQPAEAPPPSRGGRRGSLTPQEGSANGDTNGSTSPTKDKRPSLFGRLFGGRRSSEKGRSMSVATGLGEEDDPERSLSDVGPMRTEEQDPMERDELKAVRSKSVGAIMETPAASIEEEKIKQQLERLQTREAPDEPTETSPMASSAISRHDQFHGLGRQGTKEQE